MAPARWATVTDAISRGVSATVSARARLDRVVSAARSAAGTPSPEPSSPVSASSTGSPTSGPPFGALHAAQRLVGAGDERVGGLGVAPEGRPAGAGGDRARQLALGGGLRDGLDEADGEVAALDRAGAHGDHRELVAALAAEHVLGTQRGAQAVGHDAQGVVADGVAELVVDGLEAVEVEDDERERVAVAAGAGALGLECPGEHPVVAEAREGVLFCEAQGLALALERTGALGPQRGDGQVDERRADDRRRDRGDGDVAEAIVDGVVVERAGQGRPRARRASPGSASGAAGTRRRGRRRTGRARRRRCSIRRCARRGPRRGRWRAGRRRRAAAGPARP